MLWYGKNTQANLKQSDSKTYQVILGHTCGLPNWVYAEWQRQSFLDFPDELSQYRFPRTKFAAEAGAVVLIAYLKSH